MPYFEVVAHRGVPTEAPENTIPSFQRAIDLGADAIEFDVRLTHDLVPRICTDKLQQALDFRQQRSRWTMAGT